MTLRPPKRRCSPLERFAWMAARELCTLKYFETQNNFMKIGTKKSDRSRDHHNSKTLIWKEKGESSDR